MPSSPTVPVATTCAPPPPFTPAPPTFRCLRAYTVDPSLTGRLDTAPVSETMFKVPWEHVEPGPIGEYLEVIDVDPASGYFYEPSTSTI